MVRNLVSASTFDMECGRSRRAKSDLSLERITFVHSVSERRTLQVFSSETQAQGLAKTANTIISSKDRRERERVRVETIVTWHHTRCTRYF
jgi:hypothetical protein